MKTSLILLFVLLVGSHTNAQQNNYAQALTIFQKQYVDSHEVVKGDDKQYIKFFKIKEKYKVPAKFERINDTTGFIMKTSGKESRKYFKYGILAFTLDNIQCHLTIYQSEQLMQNAEYKDYLFVPFTDETSGEESYGGGRYLDFVFDDIKNGRLIIDFNKAYNPYCTYATGYNCPIPPRENHLPVKVKAGEMEYGKKHQ
ncbi:MAG: DUF1684 domain-containing protein [Ferruginibacter sp.]